MAGNKFKGILQSKEEKYREDMKEQSSLIFHELSRFVGFMNNIGLPYSISNKILIESCDVFLVEKPKAQLLCTELRSNQRNASKMFSDIELRLWSLQKRSIRLSVFGYSDQTLVMGCTIKFVDDDRTLRNILLCCRDFNEILRESVYKQALLKSS